MEEVIVKEINFIYPSSFHPSLTDEEIMDQLAKTLVNLVNFETSEVLKFIYKKETGYKYQLGSSNDWWFDKSKNDKPDEYVLRHRYGYDRKIMDAIKTMIVWRLGIERFN